MYVTTGGTRAWVVEPSPLLTARDLLAYEDRCRVAQADLRCDQRPAKLYLEVMRNPCACKNQHGVLGIRSGLCMIGSTNTKRLTAYPY